MQDSSRIEGQGIQSLTAGQFATVETKNRNQERKQFVVSNLETVASDNIIYITGTDSREALPVFPRTSVTLETDSPFRILNPTVSTIQYVVGELFFRGVTLGASGGQGGGQGGASGGGGGSIFPGDSPRPGNKFLP